MSHRALVELRPGPDLVHSSSQFTPGPTLDPAWFNVTARLLGNGKVLLFGDETALGERQASVLLYE